MTNIQNLPFDPSMNNWDTNCDPLSTNIPYKVEYENPCQFVEETNKQKKREDRQKISKKQKKTSRWKEEIKIFCQNTSIRGIPHIMRARNKTVRVLWIAFVIILLIGWCICMLFLLRQYLEYNVIHPPQVLRDANSPFPSVTICNLRPISPEGERLLLQNHLKTPRKYAQDSNKYGKEYLIKHNNMKDYTSLTATMNFAAYLESLPNNFDSKHLGSNLSSFVIKCQMSYLSGSQRKSMPCEHGKSDRSGHWRNFIHAQYLNCYTFDILPSLQNDVMFMEIFLYLDENMNSSTCIDCFHNEIKSQLSGAVMTVHPPGTYPNINSKGINVLPGTLTEITLQNILYKQKTPPYGRCSLKTPKTIYMYGYNYTYSEFACRQNRIQRAINDQCHCMAIEYPIYRSDIPFCSSMSSFVPQGKCENFQENSASCVNEMKTAIKRIQCKTNVTNQFHRDVVESCSASCEFHSYETDRSISIWPTKLWQVEWLQSKVAVKFDLLNRPEFQPYRKIIQLQNIGHHKKALDMLYSVSVLERNLLALLINRPNFNLHKVEEKEVLSLTSFLSQSGGLFSIWLGLTMISVVEIIELIINCCSGNKKKKYKQKLSPVSENECQQTLSPPTYKS